MSESNEPTELLIQKRDWQTILERLRAGNISASQKFAVGGRKSGLLPLAAADNATELALYLIANGADVNEKFYGMTALLDACERQNHSLIDALVLAGVDLNQKSPKSGGEADETPLMASAEKCDAWAVERLLDAGADATLLTCRQQSAIHYALMFYATNPRPKLEATQIVNALLAARCPLLGTEIHFATHVRDPAMVQLLLDHGSPVDVAFPRNEENGPRKGQTPLDSVVKENSIDLVGGDFGFEHTDRRRDEIKNLLLAASGMA